LDQIWTGCGGTCDGGIVASEGSSGCLNGQYLRLDLDKNSDGAYICVRNCPYCNENEYMDEATTDMTLHCFTECKDCAAGTYSTVFTTRFRSCEPCGKDMYRGSFDHDCVSCPTSKTAQNTINSDIAQCVCKAGRILQTPTSSSMSECECHSGLRLVSDTCVPCLPGTYSAYNNQTITPCTPCGIGLYRGQHDESCVLCPQGMITETATSTSSSDCACHSGLTLVSGTCVPCLPGTYAAYDATKIQPCQPCGVGWYRGGGDLFCLLCPKGMSTQSATNSIMSDCTCPSGRDWYYIECVCVLGYGTTRGSHEAGMCIRCEPGFFKDSFNNMQCSACMRGTYSTESGRTSLCTSTCNRNEYLLNNQCICNPYHKLESGVCVQCYSTDTSVQGCKPCPARSQWNEVLGLCICLLRHQFITPGLGLPTCNDIPRDTYIVNGVIKQCAAGSYAEPGSTCVSCGTCAVGSHRSQCGWKGDTLLAGSCEECGTCPDGEVRIDCDWRGVRVDSSGRCVSTAFLSPTAWCVDVVQSVSLIAGSEGATKRNTVVSRGLGGFSFEELFGAPQEGQQGVDFICKGMCDGMQKYDSTHCGGPYACGVHTCAMRLGEGTLDEAGRVDVAHSCPVEAVGFTPEAMRSIQETECQPCKSCGRNNVHGLPDFGRGCALECSRILCEVDEIYDWMEDSVNALGRCKTCVELDDAALCSTEDYEALGLRNSDVSGNRARVHFTQCTPKRGTDVVRYGSCNLCGAAAPACRDGQYFDRCPDSGSSFEKQCPSCLVRRGTTPRNSMYVSSLGVANAVYCQVGECSNEGKTGISQSGAVCDGDCQRAACAPSEETLPCLLPHHERCVSSYPAAGATRAHAGQACRCMSTCSNPSPSASTSLLASKTSWSTTTRRCSSSTSACGMRLTWWTTT